MRTAFLLRPAVLGAFVIGLVALGVVGATVLPSQTSRAQAGLGACGDTSAPYAEVEVDSFPHLDLEVARTPSEHQIGLMDREYLPSDSGMLFVYDSEAREAYWMFHTLIPLSIAWVEKDGTIVSIKDMPRLNDPFDVNEASRTTYDPGAPYWYALEVNQGWYSDHGVAVGQQIVFCLGA